MQVFYFGYTYYLILRFYFQMLVKSKLERILIKSKIQYSDIITKQKFATFNDITASINHIDKTYLNTNILVEVILIPYFYTAFIRQYYIQVNRDVQKFEDSIANLKKKLLDSSDTGLREDVSDVESLIVKINNFTYRLMDAKLLIIESKVSL